MTILLPKTLGGGNATSAPKATSNCTSRRSTGLVERHGAQSATAATAVITPAATIQGNLPNHAGDRAVAGSSSSKRQSPMACNLCFGSLRARDAAENPISLARKALDQKQAFQ